MTKLSGPLSESLLTCAVCGSGNALIFCPSCNDKLGKKFWICSKPCAEKHISGHSKLNELGCATCNKPSTGRCSYCPALVCDGLACENACRGDLAGTCRDYCGRTCREVHEAKHFDGRSDKDKKKNP